MFAVIYTPGPAWQTGKTVPEQPKFSEHVRYMQQTFATKQLLMGGPFLDIEAALAILDVEDEAQAREIVTRDPAVQANVFQPHLHPWRVAFNQYATQSASSEI